MSNRDDFSPKTKLAIRSRASFICSNPECRCLTLSPLETYSDEFFLTGHVAHIAGASPKGPRYDPDMTKEGYV